MGHSSNYKGKMEFQGGDSYLMNRILGEDKRDLVKRYPQWKPALDKMKYCTFFDLEEGADEFLYNGAEKAYNLEEALQAIIEIHAIENAFIEIYGSWLVVTDDGEAPYKIVANGAEVKAVGLDWEDVPSKTPRSVAACPHCGGMIKLTI